MEVYDDLLLLLKNLMKKNFHLVPDNIVSSYIDVLVNQVQLDADQH